MKKLVLILTMALSTTYFVNAQELGIRLGNVTGGQAAVDAVFGLAKYSRIHADVSFGDSGVGIDALWDFLYKPLGDEIFNWYVGVGPYMHINDPFTFGVAGEIGLEYRFETVPLAIGLDWRPSFSIIENTNIYFDVAGLNVRYIFGKK